MRRNNCLQSVLPPLSAFNNRMNHRQDQVRTMWRVTNVRNVQQQSHYIRKFYILFPQGDDFVATGLPEAGDRVNWTYSPWNLFSCECIFSIQKQNNSFLFSRTPWL